MSSNKATGWYLRQLISEKQCEMNELILGNEILQNSFYERMRCINRNNVD